jgi:hypothetical protein
MSDVIIELRLTAGSTQKPLQSMHMPTSAATASSSAVWPVLRAQQPCIQHQRIGVAAHKHEPLQRSTRQQSTQHAAVQPCTRWVHHCHHVLVLWRVLLCKRQRTKMATEAWHVSLHVRTLAGMNCSAAAANNSLVVMR